MKKIYEQLRSLGLASAFVLLTTLTVVIVAGSYWAHGVRGQEKENSSTDATPLKVLNSSVAPNEFTKIAKQVGPAVVNINTQTLPKQSNTKKKGPHGRQLQQPQDGEDDDQDQGQGQGQDGMPEFFRHFFGGQMPDMQGGQDDQVRESLGSGFIVDPKGYIITNNHVIDKADKIYVKLSTDANNTDLGRPARLIGTDKATDLAVIKIETSTPLPTVKLGNSDNVQVGDWAVAIGSPFSYSQSVTAGIISAKNRTEPGAAGQFQHFLQTDAAINPGNSGGPLLNMNGEVIGVNTAIITQSGGYQGIGFALPSNTVVDVYNQLIAPGHKVTRGSIGIYFSQGNSDSVNRVYGINHGVLVNKVEPGGPADKAGLKPRDIVISVDGRQIKDGDDLVAEIASRRPGSTVRLSYLRDGKPADASVTIGDRDKIFNAQAAQADEQNPDDKGDAAETKLGLVVREASPATQEKIHAAGVAIQSVRAGSYADLKGLQPGLVILRVNKQPTATREQFNALASKLKIGDDVVFEVVDPKRPNDGITFVGGTLQ
jgi:serine protease Do